MNSDDHEAKQDDLLEQAISVVKGEASASNLSPRTVTDTLAALRKAEAKHSPRIWNRVIDMTLTQKIAAAIGLTISGLTIYFIFSLLGSSVTYAQVAAQIRGAKSLVFDATAQPVNSPKEITMHYMCMDTGLTRIDMPGGATMIMDTAAHQMLMLQPSSKTATLTDFSVTGPAASQPAGGQHDMVAQFKKLGEAQGEPIGEQTVGGVKAKEFRASVKGIDAFVFADARTGALLKVEFKNFMGMSNLTFSNFNFDAQLDPSQFSIVPPAGYTLKKQSFAISGDLADNVVPILKMYAEHNGGEFPPNLTDWAGIFKKMMGTTKPTTAPAGLTKIAPNIGATFGLLAQFQKGKTYDYLPSNAKLGDADKIVLWFQPKDSQTYKAIYGDLHVAEVTADKLPAPPIK
jgi:hypothetical protein